MTKERQVHAVLAPEAGAGVDDILVFEQSGPSFSLIDGVGRGAGWAGIVEIERDGDSLPARAWKCGSLVHHAGPRPVQIAGPYYARHAVAVPVGQRHVVVLGSDRPIDIRDAAIVRLAAKSVDRTHGVPADKLLADELELVHVLRTLMAYRPETVRDTIRHVAMVAATALSCEVAIIQVVHDDERLIEAITTDQTDPTQVGAEMLRHLAAATGAGSPVVDQAITAGTSPFDAGIVAQITLPLGSDPALGALALGHRAERARGFTSLCQRIGRAIAEAAELLISQAAAREHLAAERDLLARISSTDALTGIGNRRAWEAAAAHVMNNGASRAFVLSCDLDGLKQANDRHGHSAGDELLRATATLLSSCIRDSDLVVRMGGDEFAVLLNDADAATARRVCARIRSAERRWRVTEHGLMPRLSLGTAAVDGRDIEAARDRADAAMYASKRRRARRAAKAAAAPRPERRSSKPSPRTGGAAPVCRCVT